MAFTPLACVGFWPSSALRRIQNRKPQEQITSMINVAVTHRSFSFCQDGTGMMGGGRADALSVLLVLYSMAAAQPLFLSFRPGILLPKTNQKHTHGRLLLHSDNHSPPCLSTESTPVCHFSAWVMLAVLGWNYFYGFMLVSSESTKELTGILSSDLPLREFRKTYTVELIKWLNWSVLPKTEVSLNRILWIELSSFICALNMRAIYFVCFSSSSWRFVMNRVQGDYFETLLYKIFVSIDEHTNVAEVSVMASCERV